MPMRSEKREKEAIFSFPWAQNGKRKLRRYGMIALSPISRKGQGGLDLTSSSGKSRGRKFKRGTRARPGRALDSTENKKYRSPGTYTTTTQTKKRGRGTLTGATSAQKFISPDHSHIFGANKTWGHQKSSNPALITAVCSDLPGDLAPKTVYRFDAL